jgi:hypothetical protein
MVQVLQTVYGHNAFEKQLGMTGITILKMGRPAGRLPL